MNPKIALLAKKIGERRVAEARSVRRQLFSMGQKQKERFLRENAPPPPEPPPEDPPAPVEEYEPKTLLTGKK
jgi:hypothetical protein